HLVQRRNPTTSASLADDGQIALCAYTSARQRSVWRVLTPSRQPHARSRCVRRPMFETLRESVRGYTVALQSLQDAQQCMISKAFPGADTRKHQSVIAGQLG